MGACGLLALAATRIEKERTFDRAEYDDLMAGRITEADQLLAWFIDQQERFAPMIPPGLDSFTQPGDPDVLVIDLDSPRLPQGLKKALGAVVPVFRNTVPTLDVFMRERLDGSIEAIDAAGNLIYIEPPPADYRAPLDALQRASRQPYLHYPELARYRLNARLTLLPMEYVEHFLYAKERIEDGAARVPGEDPPLMQMMTGGAEEEVRISAMNRTPNGLLLELTYPAGFSGSVWSAYSLDVPVCAEQNCPGAATNTFRGLDSVWALVDSNIVLTGETQTLWLDTRPMGLDEQMNPVHRFYAFGANTDADGDGLNDGFEMFVTKTNPLNEDSDGDGMTDGWEHANGLNPHSAQGADGAEGDVDGDGLNNALEFKLGFNPNMANEIVDVPFENIGIEFDVLSAGLQKCGFPDFETGHRNVDYGSTYHWEFICSGSTYQDAEISSGAAWYSPLCETYSFNGSQEESAMRVTPDCQFESAAQMSWSNEYVGERVWWVVSQSPSNCWTTLTGGTNWYIVNGYEGCDTCTNSSHSVQSGERTGTVAYSEDCSESWFGAYHASLSDEYTTGELIGHVQTQLAGMTWTSNWQASGAACRDLSEEETGFSLSKMRVRFHLPATSNGVAYRFSWVRLFTPEDTNQAAQAEGKTVYVAGTGGDAYVGDGPWSTRHDGSADDF